MDFEERRTYYNRCRPFEPLEPYDSRNLDMDNYQNGAFKARGKRWADVLWQKLSLADQPTMMLFTGMPGSGKTTELKRLQKRLREDSQLLPVYINADEVLDLSAEIDAVDLLMAIVFRVEASVLEGEGGDPESAGKDGYLARLWHWLNNTDVELKKAQFTVLDSIKLMAEMKTRPTLRHRVRRIMADHYAHFHTEAAHELIKLEERAKKLGHRGVVVLFDSIDKLRGISSNWHDVLESAERIFSGGAPRLELPIHVLFTVPAALATRIRHIHFLPMIKVRNKHGEPSPEGIALGRRLLEKRVPASAMAEIFGPDWESRLEVLITGSGGYPREMILLLQEALSETEFPLTDAAFKRLLVDLENQYRMLVPGEAFPWLARVAQTHFLTIDNDDHRRAAAHMLANHAVMCYLNDELWYDLHPAVAKIPGVTSAVRALREKAPFSD